MKRGGVDESHRPKSWEFVSQASEMRWTTSCTSHASHDESSRTGKARPQELPAASGSRYWQGKRKAAVGGDRRRCVCGSWVGSLLHRDVRKWHLDVGYVGSSAPRDHDSPMHVKSTLRCVVCVTVCLLARWQGSSTLTDGRACSGSGRKLGALCYCAAISAAVRWCSCRSSATGKARQTTEYRLRITEYKELQGGKPRPARQFRAKPRLTG